MRRWRRNGLRNLLAPLAACVLLLGAATAAPASAAGGAQSSIVNGSPATIEQFPSLAHIVYYGLPFIRHPGWLNEFECTGTVVAPRVVMTAAHCAVLGRGGIAKARRYRVETGATDFESGGGRQYSDVERVAYHAGFDLGRLRYDAALLILRKPVAAPPIALAKPSEPNLTSAGTSVVITGWGVTKPALDWAPPTLRRTRTRIAGTDYCRRHTRGFLPSFAPSLQLCAVAPPSTSCHGDSGGPAMVRDHGTLVEVGVISAGDPECNPAFPETLTRVASIYGWVQRWIDAAELGAVPPPVPVSEAKPPRMTQSKALEFAIKVLMADYGRRFSEPRKPRFDGCRRRGRGAIRCRLSWFHRNTYFHGTASFHYGHNREGSFVNYAYRIASVGERCWFRHAHPDRCPTSLRHYP